MNNNELRDETTTSSLPIGNTNVGGSPSLSEKRVYEFRAWDKGNNKMINALHKWEVFNNEVTEYRDGFPSSGTGFHITDLMQYTGRSDKNNKKIFEGDIVRGILNYPAIEFLNEPAQLVNEVGVVKFIDCCWELWNESEYERGVITRYDTIEVLGNIYENPELLRSVQL